MRLIDADSRGASLLITSSLSKTVKNAVLISTADMFTATEFNPLLGMSDNADILLTVCFLTICINQKRIDAININFNKST